LLGDSSNRATTTSELPTCEYIFYLKYISKSAEDEGFVLIQQGSIPLSSAQVVCECDIGKCIL